MSSSAALSTPEGPGSVSGAPNLPAGLTDRNGAAAAHDHRPHAAAGSRS